MFLFQKSTIVPILWSFAPLYGISPNFIDFFCIPPFIATISGKSYPTRKEREDEILM